MIVIEIPGREPLKINHVVLDYNGTAAVDGMLLKGVKERIARLKDWPMCMCSLLIHTAR